MRRVALAAGLDVNRRASAVGVAAERAAAARCRIQHRARRRINHPEHRLAVLHQRNIDRELAIAFDELPRAVQRIDQPEPLPVASRLEALWRRLLGQHLDFGCQGTEARADDPLRCQIGLGQGRAIVLERDVECGAIDAHDLIARGIGNPDHGAQPVRQLLRAQVSAHRHYDSRRHERPDFARTQWSRIDTVLLDLDARRLAELL